jgi:GxxExxY protein
MTKNDINQLAYEVVGCAIEVHRQIGPGLLESVYEECFCEELTFHGIQFVRQMKIPVIYRTKALLVDLRLDVMVEGMIVCELKAAVELKPVYEAQILSHMKLLEIPKGLLINFHSENIVKNTKHFINTHFFELPDF